MIDQLRKEAADAADFHRAEAAKHLAMVDLLASLEQFRQDLQAAGYDSKISVQSDCIDVQILLGCGADKAPTAPPVEPEPPAPARSSGPVDPFVQAVADLSPLVASTLAVGPKTPAAPAADDGNTEDDQADPDADPPKPVSVEDRPRLQPTLKPAPKRAASSENVGMPWTPADDALLLLRKFQGAPHTEKTIAGELGRSVKSVSVRANKLGKDRRRNFCDLALHLQEVVTLETAAGDLRLARHMTKGIGIGSVAGIMKIQKADLQARWAQLTAGCQNPTVHEVFQALSLVCAKMTKTEPPVFE